MTISRFGVVTSTTAAGVEGFQLLELSVGGKGTSSSGIEGGNKDEDEDGNSENMVLLSVRGDGRVSIDGGGGVVVKDGDLEVSQGDATFKVLYHEWVTFASGSVGNYFLVRVRFSCQERSS